MGSPFDRSGINRGVTTGDVPAVLGDQTVRVISAAIVDVNGTPVLADGITGEAITDLIGVEVADIVDSGNHTYTVTKTDGSSFIIDASAFDITGQEVINLINAYTGSSLIQAAHTEATVTVANPSTTPVSALDAIEISGVSYRVGGSTPAHARLRTSVTLSPNSLQLPRLGTVPVTGTVSASIENAVAGDVINDVIIHSVHSSYADDRTGSPVVVDDRTSTFAWNFQAGDPAQVVTFTVSFSVSGVIDGQVERSVHTETVNLSIIAAPVLFWTGAITQPDLDTLSTTTNLADNIIAGIPRLTQRENFSSPYTLEYDGGAAGATPSLYAAIIVDQSILITSLRAEGISVTIESHNDSTAGRTLYVSQALLSEGPHNLTWRT